MRGSCRSVQTASPQTTRAPVSFSFARLSEIVRQAARSLSTKVTLSAPRESASSPSAPEPAKRSSTRAPSTGPIRLNAASRTRSPVGRVARPFGAAIRVPRCVPAMIRIATIVSSMRRVTLLIRHRCVRAPCSGARRRVRRADREPDAGRARLDAVRDRDERELLPRRRDRRPDVAPLVPAADVARSCTRSEHTRIDRRSRSTAGADAGPRTAGWGAPRPSTWRSRRPARPRRSRTPGRVAAPSCGSRSASEGRSPCEPGTRFFKTIRRTRLAGFVTIDAGRSTATCRRPPHASRRRRSTPAGSQAPSRPRRDASACSSGSPCRTLPRVGRLVSRAGGQRLRRAGRHAARRSGRRADPRTASRSRGTATESSSGACRTTSTSGAATGTLRASFAGWGLRTLRLGPGVPATFVETR